MDEGTHEDTGLPPSLAKLLTPEHKRNTQEEERENREILERAERYLAEAGQILDRMRR